MQAVGHDRQLSHLTELLTMFPNKSTSPINDANNLITTLPVYDYIDPTKNAELESETPKSSVLSEQSRFVKNIAPGMQIQSF